MSWIITLNLSRRSSKRANLFSARTICSTRISRTRNDTSNKNNCSRLAVESRSCRRTIALFTFASVTFSICTSNRFVCSNNSCRNWNISTVFEHCVRLFDDRCEGFVRHSIFSFGHDVSLFRCLDVRRVCGLFPLEVIDWENRFFQSSPVFTDESHVESSDQHVHREDSSSLRNGFPPGDHRSVQGESCCQSTSLSSSQTIEIDQIRVDYLSAVGFDVLQRTARLSLSDETRPSADSLFVRLQRIRQSSLRTFAVHSPRQTLETICASDDLHRRAFETRRCLRRVSTSTNSDRWIASEVIRGSSRRLQRRLFVSEQRQEEGIEEELFPRLSLVNRRSNGDESSRVVLVRSNSRLGRQERSDVEVGQQWNVSFRQTLSVVERSGSSSERSLSCWSRIHLRE